MTRKEYFLLAVLAAVQFTHIVDFMIMMPLGPQLMRLFDIDPRQFSLVVSSYTFSAGICGFAGAFFLDRFDRKAALLWLNIGFTVGTVLCALAPSYELLLVTRCLTGAFGGVLGALVLAIVGDAFPVERRASAMSIVMMAFSAASVFGVPFGLYLATLFTWHAPFFFLGGFGIVMTAGIVFYVPTLRGHLRDASAPKAHPMEALSLVLENPNQLRALLFMVLLMLGQFTVIPFISPYMVSNVGFTEQQLTYIYLCGGALTIFTSPVIGRWADRYGQKRIFTIFMFLNLLPLLLITNMPAMSIVPVLIVTTFFFVCGGGRMIPAMSMITSTVRPQNRGSFMSINSAVQQLAAGFSSFIAGVIVVERADGTLAHYNWVGYLAVACTVVAIFAGRQLRVVDHEVRPETAGIAATGEPESGAVVASVSDQA
ncbi:Predicted arabinose efflux permease, MFS family [Catalinimonas alkaloidigena]|uniref:Predicted arabinose efflux permease, MFS family n=1 Tax=Catalinimonas alkaloidigena TaxID=1075417 RepID=A0A1G9EF04_9BACT|nr:MFS transporter [Catalinimonas alkaloidigena]SDK74668.1 Predicted arabinose efflux permease, MFS family [Catalinimonas alkaloidigena]